MNKKEKYLTLNESRNAMDFLIQSLVFLSQVEQNNYYLKWFIIAFHGAVHSFMLLVLQKVDVKLIYTKQPKYTKCKDGFDPFDGYLRDCLGTYEYIKNNEYLGSKAFSASELHDSAMKELNNKLRNQFIHFKPMIWGAEAWYPAEVCFPLLDILRFCLGFEGVGFDQQQKEVATTYIDSIKCLLIKYRE